MKQKLAIIIRFLVSFGLLFLIIRHLDGAKLVDISRHLRISWAATALVMLFLMRVLMAVRWQYVLRANKIDVPLRELVKIIFMSTSMGQILPGGFSEDLFRGYKLTRKYGNLTSITATILTDRFVGVYCLFLLATIGELIAMATGHATGLLPHFILIQIGILGVWHFSISLQAIVARRASGAAQPGYFFRLCAKMLAIFTHATQLKSILARLVSVALLVQMSRCLTIYFTFRAFGAVAPLEYYFIFIPFLFFAIFLPISIGGLGVREAAFVYFFNSTGIAPEISLAASIGSHLLQIIIAMPGVVLWLLEKNASRELPAGPASNGRLYTMKIKAPAKGDQT